MTQKRIALHLALPLLLAGSAAASEPGKFEQTLAVTGPVSLDISSGPGGVTVRSGPSRTVLVRAIIRAELGRADMGLAEANIRALELHPPVEQNGNSIRVGYVQNASLLRGVSITYEIQTPRDTQVQAHADAGGLHISGIAGPVTTSNDAGASEVSDVQGAVTMTTRAGGIAVRNVDGAAVLHNQTGGIELDGVRGDVTADTKSGRIELANVAGQVHAETQSASIRLRGITGEATATNHSGSIESVGSGGVTRAETASGSIRIAQASPAAVHAVSRSGAIRIALAPGKGYSLSLHSDKGKVAVPSLRLPGKEQRDLDTAVLGGGPAIEARTRSSRIEVE